MPVTPIQHNQFRNWRL